MTDRARSSRAGGQTSKSSKPLRSPPRRPRILALAGVNGAGKSSVGGSALLKSGLDWFNPDTYTRLYQRESSLSLEEANAMAWEEGRRRLGIAIDQGLRHAFETTLGGQTITQMLEQASRTHDVDVWYCGLSSLDLHLERVKQRVAAGGHDIDPAKIAQRYIDSPINLIRLMPFVSKLVVYDNSASVGAGEVMPNPARVLAVASQRVLYPSTPESLARTPVWARPLVERALQIQDNAQQLCR